MKFILLVMVASSVIACTKQELTAPAESKNGDQMAKDIAKIREIKEQEQKDKATEKAKSEQFGRDMKEGLSAPRIDFK